MLFSRVLSLHDCQCTVLEMITMFAVNGEVGAGPLGSKWIQETDVIQVAAEPLYNSAF